MAEALGRTPATIRRWEKKGLLPRAPIVLEGVGLAGRRRLYPPELIVALREVAQRERFGRRLESDRIVRQQSELVRVWCDVIARLNAEVQDHGVMEDSPIGPPN